MHSEYKKIKNLFLRQSYLDAWEDYQRSLQKTNFIRWDFIILTASNEEQAEGYRRQIDSRIKRKTLPQGTEYVVLSDPDGKRAGSGGATFNVLKYLAETNPVKSENPFRSKRVLVIHSGGDSKRIPQYSACGKLFSPVPRELPDGRPSTLFDEFIISVSAIPSRIREGLLTLSGDVLLLFNPLQIDFQFHGAAAISIKAPKETGEHHGVFLNDGKGNVSQFLHKQPTTELQKIGAVNEQGNVDLDTGAIIIDSAFQSALFSLISTDKQVDQKKFDRFVNEKARISFYGDFLYPLGKASTLSQYLEEKAEGEICPELIDCRKDIWDVVHSFQMKLFGLSPAEFIHFGTTGELSDLMTKKIGDYLFLDWKKKIASCSADDGDFSVYNSIIGNESITENHAFIENCDISGFSRIGSGSVVSGIHASNITIPAGAVYHALHQRNGDIVLRIYSVKDNPKEAVFFEKDFSFFLEKNILKTQDIWDAEPYDLWTANLYPSVKNMDEAVKWASLLYKMSQGQASSTEIENWKKQERTSLKTSFNHTNQDLELDRVKELEDTVLIEKFTQALKKQKYDQEAFSIFGKSGISEKRYFMLLNAAEKSDAALRTRIYYSLSRYMKIHHLRFDGAAYDHLENIAFTEISNRTKIFSDSSHNRKFSFHKDEVIVDLPLRVNWGGGWTDTPPYCFENGGTVLNAAILLDGQLPIQVYVRKLDTLHIEFESVDIEAKDSFTSFENILNCSDPYDPFVLHKASLQVCGLISSEDNAASLSSSLEKIGGGIYLSTNVKNVPKGSGLGTSSILAAGCVKALSLAFDLGFTHEELFERVLRVEQLMSTGGGWQDQVGGLLPGIKLLHTNSGEQQIIHVEPVNLPSDVQIELNERFALIYTGQRRLARNLLRDVMGGYISNRPDTIYALSKIRHIAVLMKYELERGHIDKFATLLNEHWELAKMLDAGTTNTCIDQIFLSCEDLIAGKFIVGAGGGGFLQVILKKGIHKKDLAERLNLIFQDSGVAVWDTELGE